MRLIQNSGNDRVVDVLRDSLEDRSTLSIASPSFSLFAYGELQNAVSKAEKVRLVLPGTKDVDFELLGDESDREFRNRLQSHWLAAQCADLFAKRGEVRQAHGIIPQSTLCVGDAEGNLSKVVTGSCQFTSSGLGITPSNQFGLIQATETADEHKMLSAWFEQHWKTLPAGEAAKEAFLAQLKDIASHKKPSLIYYLTLWHLFKDLGDELDEDKIVKSATGIRNTVVWNKLYKFQRDGVVGAIDKLERIGGCVIADSVGLGKTFEALAVIKYFELRNDRVLVLAPKRLRDNWTLYKANDKRNVLSSDRFNYDVLNHTDLSRDGGTSGDIDLGHVNWGNYDLVVIDESHNFRNKITHQGKESRYDKLMRKIIREGVKTRVLMLSATPVNNRLADLKNQIAFLTEGVDDALSEHGIASIDTTVRKAQVQFNKWLKMDDPDRKPARLMEMLGFDYFKLLDLLTIARSRKHIERYYGVSETGRFPDRLKPINIKADVDLEGHFPAIRDINNEIRRLNLSSYAPLRYVLPHKQADYEAKYSQSIRGGTSFFRQIDREESLIHLLRVNLLKRMESSVVSFALTIRRQLADVEAMLKRIDEHIESFDEINIDDIEVDDSTFEALLVGRKVKVLLQDVDRVRWRQDLQEDRNRLATLLSAAEQITPDRDAKLSRLREIIAGKTESPINPGNKKVIVFTAFADTAEYLYRELAPWAATKLKVNAAVISGTGTNKTNMRGLRTDLASLLTSFAPKSKERPAEMAGEGEIDLLIATDCISEGQNLQDCDYLVNFDIHWNPVRIIQRFGRIDRLGSPNTCIQLVNFWANMELEEYINLEQRVSGRMVLLDISATGEENLIEQEAGNEMNDLEYRRKQLLKLQESVIDLEDLSSGVSIADLTLNDFRIDLAGYLREHQGTLDRVPMGVFSVVPTSGDADNGENGIKPGIIFCLRAEGDSVRKLVEPGYPLAPHYLVHVSEEGEVVLTYLQAKQILDRMKKLCLGRDMPDAVASGRFDKRTSNGKDMRYAQELLSTSVASIVGKNEERAVASLFSPGGTHARKGEFAGSGDFEVVAWLAVLPENG